MTKDAEKKTVAHKHFKMGTADIYTLVGYWAGPSKALAGSNPRAYNIQLEGRPEVCRFICDHCGTPINNHFIIKDSAGERFSVGSSCIEKIGQQTLIDQAKKKRREIEKEKRRIKSEERKKARDKAHEERREKELAELERQRQANGGLTDREYAKKQLGDRRSPHAGEVISYLEQAEGDFVKGIIKSLREGDLPKGRGFDITIEIIAQVMAGKGKRSKAYKDALPKAEALMEDLESKYNAIK